MIGVEVDELVVFERVCHLLWCAGFEIAHTRPAGLHIGLRPQGVLVRWFPEEVVDSQGGTGSGPAGRVPGSDGEGWRRTVQESVVGALTVILRRAGCEVARADTGLFVTAVPNNA